MTTTAATTSASASTSNDSPMHDFSGTSEPSNDHKQSEPSPKQTPAQQLSPPSPSQPQVQQQPQQQQSSKPQTTNNANPNEQKRPMNAFLLFCKKQRSLVREKYPNLENRGITKILGDWWSKLDKEQKSKYTDLARQHKEAFMKANPDFKWCKTPMSHNNSHAAGNNSTLPSNGTNNSNDCYTNNINLKNVDVQMDVIQSNSRDSLVGNTKQPSSNDQHHQQPQHHNHHNYMKSDQLFNDQQHQQQQPGAPKPPKKRFLESTKNDLSNNDSGPMTNLGEVVPLFTLIHPPNALDRVIDEAFSEKTINSSPSGKNMCKSFNRDSNSSNLTSSIASNPILYTSTTTTQAAFMPTSVVAARPTELSQQTPENQPQAATSYSSNNDEPVDFSMNRTINATRQQIIGKSVERYLMSPSDNASNTFKKVK